jgi:hypothetical protein
VKGIALRENAALLANSQFEKTNRMQKIEGQAKARRGFRDSNFTDDVNRFGWGMNARNYLLRSNCLS